MNVIKAYLYMDNEPTRRVTVHIFTGGSRLSDIMNDPRTFIPVSFLDDHGRVNYNKLVMVNKSHIVRIEEL